jgi:hypothetical protein
MLHNRQSLNQALVLSRLWRFVGERALDKFGNDMPQADGARQRQRDQASSLRLNIVASISTASRSLAHAQII